MATNKKILLKDLGLRDYKDIWDSLEKHVDIDLHNLALEVKRFKRELTSEKSGQEYA